MANVAQNLLQYTTNAMVAYRSNNAATGPVSAGWTAVKVDAFVPSTTGFAAQLMTDGQGHYRIAMRGTDSVNPLNPNSDLSLDAALAAGKWHPQMDDAIRFTGEAIKEIKRIEGVDSLDQVRDRLDGSGHSAGGGLYEVSGKFYGLSGVNLDGPGMGQQVQSDRFAQLKQEQRNNGLADLQDNYEWNAGDFQRRQYTAVGEAGQNTPGVDLYVSPSLQMRNSTLANVYQSGVELGSTGLWVVGSQIGAQHGLASIAKLEGFGDAMRTQADLFAQQNLAKGLSASGYAEGSHQYESLGGSGMAFSVTVYKNSAGQLVEVRVPGQWLGGTFEAKGAPIASVADANGKVHALGVMDPVDSMPEVVVTASRIQDPPASRNSANYVSDIYANDHLAVIKPGGTLSDLWVLQRNGVNSFADAKEFYAAVIASNPGITDVNQIPAGTTIHLPEKLKDGSITYNYANGVSINSNRVNGEYHMLVPDGSGGTIVYSRKADESGYTVREIHTDKTGAVTLDFTGTQASLDAEIKPLAYQWSTGEEVGKVQVFANGSSITSVQDMSTQDITETVRDSQQNVVESKTYDNTAARVEEAQYNALLAGVELFDAIRHKNNLGAVSAITRLVNESRIAAEQPVVFSPQVGAVLGLIGALDSFADAQTDAQKLVATARLVLSANTTYAAFNNGKGFLDAGAGLTTMNVAGGVLALASLKDALESGNPFAIASTVMTLTNSAVATGMLQGVSMFGPQAMIAVAICSVVFASVFEVEYPDPPPAGTVEIGRLADGTLGLLIKDEVGGQVHQTRRLDGQVVSDSAKATDTLDWGLGAQVLSQRMGEVIGELRAQAETVGGHLVLERLPALTVHAFPSFAGNGQTNFFFSLQFNDPVSGAQQLLATAHQDLTQRYAQVAAYAGALVGDTEWAQIGLKRAAGDAFATETEGQYVDRQSGPQEADSLLTQAQADAQAASNRQSYSLLTLDLEGDGLTRRELAQAGQSLDDVKADTTLGRARLDVDNDGYLELTEWVGSKEAILGIDRNGDGRLGDASELLTGGELSDAAENLGLKRLAFFDANHDGKFDALDPYFKSFKLWLDINGDARSGVGEVYGLDEAGVRQIDLATGAVTFTDGQALTLQRTQLTAEAQGVAVSAVADGQGGVLPGQFTVQVEGRDAELNLTADAATDLSAILKLVRPNANLSAADRAQLVALAQRYGVDLNDPAALLGLGGGGNVAGSPTSTTATAGDVFTVSEVPNAEEVKAALRVFFLQVVHNPNEGPALDNRVWQASEDAQVRIKTADLLAGLAGVRLVGVQDARRGTVGLDANGDVVFTPAANQHGTGYFTYTAQDAEGRRSTAMVWLNIASVNDAPLAQADRFSVTEDQALTLAVSQLLANDSDVDAALDAGESLAVASVRATKRGTVSLNNGQVVFRPEANYQGEAGFEYTVRDAAGATATAVATVMVVGQNDAPVSAGRTVKLAARPDALLRIEADTLLAYAKDADQPYGDSLRLKRVVSVSAGSAWQQKDGSVLFKAGGTGDVVLTLEIADGQGATVRVPITVNVSAANSAAVPALPSLDQATEDTAVRITSTQAIVGVVGASKGTAFLDRDGAVVFNPTLNQNGAAQVVYRVRNADNSVSEKTVDFTIAAVNDAPVVVQPLAVQSVNEDTPLRMAERSDRDALIALALENRQEMAHAPVPVSMERIEQTLHGLFELNPGSHVVLLVQTDAGELVGLLIGCVERYFYSDALQAQLIQWYVKNAYRGTSAAPRLVKAFVAWARTRGANDVFMGISSGLNVHLTHRLMRRLGFSYLGGNYGVQLNPSREVPHAA